MAVSDEDKKLQAAFERLSRAALTNGVTEVLSRDPRTRRYLDRYGEAGVAEALVDYASTHNVWTPTFISLILPDDNPPTTEDKKKAPVGEEVARKEAAKEEDEEPADTTRAENQETPDDEWLCPACRNSPCEFLQSQQELERIVDCMAPDTSAKAKRFHAYQFMSRKLHGQLGKKNRVPLPPCCQQGLRDLFPSEDGKYTGFKLAK
jgi:hypothetical protein